MLPKRSLATALAFAAFVAAGATFAAQPTTGPAPASPLATPASTSPGMATPTPPAEAHALAADDLHVFLDGLVPYAIHHGDIAGATVAVVKDGQLLFAQGYGYSDVKTRAPVVADQTMFRPGSISKLFTWTSVMQLVERGKLDLDRDVNDYLDFKIPEKFGKPITLRNIMTHTSGFEEVAADLFVENAAHLYPLHDYLVKHMPNRIYPPGKVIAYSNYATAMAGYIVQRVSGEQYADYVQHHILTPLGMTHSSMQQPLPASLQPFMAQGYKQASDDKPVPFEFVEAAPAGALSASATDMAKFMLAHLNGGSYDGAQILKPATEKEMQTQNASIAPGLNGFDLGFYQESRNGHTIIGHAGDTMGFHSDLHLITDAGVGIFMSFNSTGKAGDVENVRVALFRAFLDRYFPYTPPEEATVADPKPDAARVAGYYISSRREDTALKLLFQIGQTKVTALPDGRVEVDAFKDFSGAVKKWREVGPLRYREVGGQTHLEFVTDKDGHIDHLFSDDFIPVLVFQRVHGLEQENHLMLFGLGTLAVCALTIALWFGGWIVRRRFDRPLAIEGRAALLRLASRLGAVVFLLVVLGWIGIISAITADEFALFNGGLNMWIGLVYVVGVLAIVGGIAMILNGVSRLVSGPGGWLVRIGDLVLALAGLYGVWAIFDYHLANFYFNI